VSVDRGKNKNIMSPRCVHSRWKSNWPKRAGWCRRTTARTGGQRLPIKSMHKITWL